MCDLQRMQSMPAWPPCWPVEAASARTLAHTVQAHVPLTPLLPRCVHPGAAMGIPKEFQQLHSSLCLHIWMLLVRLRPESKDGKQLAQVCVCMGGAT